MIQARARSFAWGFAAAATLIVGGAFALRIPVGERALGMVMAFGSGVLISALVTTLGFGLAFAISALD